MVSRSNTGSAFESACKEEVAFITANHPQGHSDGMLAVTVTGRPARRMRTIVSVPENHRYDKGERLDEMAKIINTDDNCHCGRFAERDGEYI